MIYNDQCIFPHVYTLFRPVDTCKYPNAQFTSVRTGNGRRRQGARYSQCHFTFHLQVQFRHLFYLEEPSQLNPD